MFLCECTCVRGRAGNGRMKSWQRAVTPTPPACLCCSVSLSHQRVEEWLTVRRASQVRLRYYCVVHFVPGQVCRLWTERTYAVMAWFFLGDWGTFAALLPQQVTFWGIGACVPATEWHHLQCQIWHATLLTRSHMSRDIGYLTEFMPLFFSSLRHTHCTFCSREKQTRALLCCRMVQMCYSNTALGWVWYHWLSWSILWC